MNIKLSFLSLVFGTLLLSPLRADPSPSPAELLRRGIFEEEVNKDFEKAVTQLHEVVKLRKLDEQAAGTALFRLAEIARKQGKPDEAAKLFQQVITDYPEQKVLTRLAEERIVAAGGKVPAMSDLASPEELAFIKKVVRLFKESPDLLAEEWKSGPLHHAAYSGWLTATTNLLDNGMKVDDRDNIQRTALHIAAAGGRNAICELLLKRKADANAVDRDGYTPLHLAAMSNRPVVVATLLANGAKPDLQPTKWEADRVMVMPLGTALHMAGRRNFARVADELIKAKADVNAATKIGQTPLMAAARNDAADVVELLLKAGADIEQKFSSTHQKGQTALHDATWFGGTRSATLLLEKGANPNARKAEGTELYAPIHHTALRDCFTVAKVLAQHGADLKATDAAGNTALHLAVGPNGIASDEFVLWLVEQGLDPLQPNTKGEMPLYIATGKRNELLTKNVFYKRWSKYRAITFVRKGSSMPAGAWRADGDDAKPPTLKAFLERVIGPGYAERPIIAIANGFIVMPNLRIWRANTEGELVAIEQPLWGPVPKAEQKPGVAIPEMELRWGDIIEVDTGLFSPQISLAVEAAALTKHRKWTATTAEPLLPDSKQRVVLHMEFEAARSGGNGTNANSGTVRLSWTEAETTATVETPFSNKILTWSLAEIGPQRVLHIFTNDDAQKNITNTWTLPYSLDGQHLALLPLRPAALQTPPPFKDQTFLMYPATEQR